MVGLFVGQGVLDASTLVAGLGAVVVVGGVAVKTVAWLLRRMNRCVDEVRSVFGDVPPDQVVSFPLPPSLEYLPKVYPGYPNDIAFSEMPGSVSVRIEPLEPRLFNVFARERGLVARLVLPDRSVTVAVVMRKLSRDGGYYENGVSRHGCGLVVGLDPSGWKRPHRHESKGGVLVRALRGSHWVHAGEPCLVEWQRYEGEFVEYSDPVGLHPHEVVKETGWVLARQLPGGICHPMTMPYRSSQECSTDTLWDGRVVYPYYLVVESGGMFQAMRRRVTFDRNHVSERWGERFVQWKGLQRGTFAEAVRDLFEHYGDLGCSPVYARSERDVFKPLRDGEVEKGSVRCLFEHLYIGQSVNPVTAANRRVACGLLAVVLRHPMSEEPEHLIWCEDNYRQQQLADTLTGREVMPCPGCLAKAKEMVSETNASCF